MRIRLLKIVNGSIEIIVKQTSIKVYDENGNFRELNKNNYDDDIVVGSVLFSLDFIDILLKYYIIIGCFLFDENLNDFPIDIQQDKIVLFEGVYNSLNEECKKELVDYNISSRPKYLWSRFYIEWLFLLNGNCFKENGPLFLLCNNLLSNEKAINYIIKNKISIYEPRNYYELGKMVDAILNAFEVDINKLDYDAAFKYLIDSVRNGYYIRLDAYQIKKCFYDICSICNNEIGKNVNGKI